MSRNCAICDTQVPNPCHSCADCDLLFCSADCQDEHMKLGGCPDPSADFTLVLAEGADHD